MPKAESINQNLPPDALPDFRRLGTVMRIVMLVNGLVLLAAIAQAVSMQDIFLRFMDMGVLLQPVLLSCMLLFYLLSPYLQRLVYWQGAALVILLAATITHATSYLGGDLFAFGLMNNSFYVWRNTIVALVLSLLLLLYFKMRALSLSTALHDARLQALQARIRPHFLFNSINAVLSIVRADPKRAETALEDMADLFRMAMEENHEMVPLRSEIALARQYLAIEKLRLGERLQESWHIDDALNDAQLPPLMLQPLLENAVYHGIEPLTEGGMIEVKLQLVGNEMHLDVRNPCQGQCGVHNGHKMALANIRERLALKFDVEAQYSVKTVNGFYQVHIQIPYVKAETQAGKWVSK